ncbi:MAG: PAS domain-containing protein [Planctomycetaceae bacterium]
MDSIDLEREFPIEELFFSTTDERGVILDGNRLFAEISGYSREELIGAPHSIIRHPDMPRVVFDLLWKTIKAGQTIAAYVKNRAKDKRYYWVLAVAMPCRGGYLSVRLKPTTPLWRAAQGLYADLLRIEQSIEVEPKRRRAAMDASGAELFKRLAELGFRSYEDFMMQALTQELEARDLSIGASNSRIVMGPSDALLTIVQSECRALDKEFRKAYERIGQFRSTSMALLDTSAIVLQQAHSIRMLSMNATIAASQLGRQGATLQAVSESLGSVSDSSSEATGVLSERMRSVVGILDRLVFDLAATKLQSEISLQFVAETLEAGSHEDNGQLHSRLKTLFDAMTSRTRQAFEHVEQAERELHSLRSQIVQLERNNRILRFVQFAGSKESVVSHAAESVAHLFQEVRQKIVETSTKCDVLASEVASACGSVRQLLDVRHRIQPHLEQLTRFSAGESTAEPLVTFA